MLASIVGEYGAIQIVSLRKQGKVFTNEISRSLAFIEKYDLRRFRTVVRTTGFILDRTLACGRNSAEYKHSLRCTSIDYESPDPDCDEFLRAGFFAGLIIHEATHGRIRDFGIETTERNRIRIERICVLEENRFYKRIGYLKEGLTEDLSRQFDPSEWEDIWEAGSISQLRMSFARLRQRSRDNKR